MSGPSALVLLPEHGEIAPGMRLARTLNQRAHLVKVPGEEGVEEAVENSHSHHRVARKRHLGKHRLPIPQ